MTTFEMDLATVTPEVTNENDIYCPPSHEIGNFFLSVFMSIEMIVGLPSNVVALWIFCFRMKFWKIHTLFLFNLVLADFLLIISVPFRIDAHLREEHWVFGPLWCQINHFMLTVNRSASIAFMTVVALHRYFKVVHIHSCISRMRRSQAGILIGLVWTSVICISIPLLTTDLIHRNGEIQLCRSFHAYIKVPRALQGHYVAFITEFFLPWFVLLYCSVRITCFLHQRQLDRQEKVRQAIVAVGVISLVFTVCFLPGVITGLGALYIKTFHNMDCKSFVLFSQGFKLCIAFTYLNSTLDPVIYCFSSSMFRDILKSSVGQLCFGRSMFTPVSTPTTSPKTSTMT